MPNLSEVMSELKSKGTAQTRKTFSNHGAPENMFGVKVADMKVIAKKIKGDQAMAMDLFATGNSDAMYLAGIVADGSKMTTKQLDDWAKKAPWYFISEYAVPGVAHENKNARTLAMKWINSKKANIASCGWSTYSGIVAVKPDEELDKAEIKQLLDKVVKEIPTAPNRVRYTMNGFVIAVASYVKSLTKDAKSVAKQIGKVEVDMGGTSCKVPLATEYIEKIEKAGRLGKKRKTIKC